MIGILVALKSILEKDAVVTALGILDTGLNIIDLFGMLKSKFKKDSVDYQIVCVLEQTLEESCSALGWEYDSIAVSQEFDLSELLNNTMMTKDGLRILFTRFVGMEIEDDALDVIIDCFDKNVAGKEKLFRYLTQKWMRYMGEDNRSILNAPLFLTAIPATVDLIGCEEIIQDINNLLDKNNIVSIHSNGGVGKKAIVARIINNIKKDMEADNSRYEHIAWLTSTGDIKKDITELDIPAIKSAKSLEEKYILARDFLGKTSTFLVINNMDDPPSDDDVNELNTISGKTKILIITKAEISIGKSYNLKDLDECIAPNKNYSNISIVTHLPQVNFFVGRSEELQKIKDLVRNDGKVCLYGMGGIGKSVLAKALCIDFFKQKEYQNVVYIPVINGLLRALAEDKNLLIESDGVEDAKAQSDYAYGYFKLNALEAGVGDKTLLVFDNLETTEDPLFSRIISLPYDLVICSRNPIMGNYTKSSYHLKEISDSGSIRKIFEQSYGRKLNDNELNDAAKIFQSVRNHTLAIGLLGNQLKYYGYTPSEYMAEGGLFTRLNKRFRKKGDDSIYEQLYELFDAKTLSLDEISVMKAMCLTPETGIAGHIMEELSGQECFEEVQDLKQKGWIQQDDISRFVFLHPVVKEVVLSELGISAEDKEIQPFTNNLMDRIKNSWDKKQEKLLPYKELALAYYFRFPFPSVNRFNQYLILAKYFWVVNCPDLGIEIMNKVKQLFINPDGSHMYSSQEAEALLQIGFIYHGKGDYKRAEDNLSLAVRIFGNRYGAALAHLAQAKMSKKTEAIEEIEPLLSESLQIREKYWSNTQSEAASLHIYAKVYSAYQYKLEKAIKYEKKADRLFSSSKPGGRNESSSKYILGWLNIQLSDGDEEFFEYGLSLLEKAKDIRIKNVGQYGFWMEDIYRKLGLAYEMKNDINKAVFYFEELLEVAKYKYESDKSSSVIIETHKSLERLYSQLGEAEKAKRSKKYLQIYG